MPARAALRWTGRRRAGRRAGDVLPLEITDDASVRAALEWRPDAVVHLAAVASVRAGAAGPGAAWDRECGRHGPARGRGRLAAPGRHGCDPVVLLVSSGEVYGAGPGCAATSRPTRCCRSRLTRRARWARRWRRWRHGAGPGLRVVVARPFPHTGPGQSPDYVVPGLRRRLRAARAHGRPRSPDRQPRRRCATCSTCATWSPPTACCLTLGAARRGLQRRARRRAVAGGGVPAARGADRDRGGGSRSRSGADAARPTSRISSGIRLNSGAPRAGRRRSHSNRRSRNWSMPKRTDLKTILLIGSGPIVIGQGAEFDYSGTQAVRALKEEGYRVVLVNSNPATIMTDPELADRTYIEPVTPEWVAKVIERERPDALLPTMGGQTALNVAMALAARRHAREVRRRADRRQRAGHPSRRGPAGVRAGDARGSDWPRRRDARSGASTRRSRRWRRPAIPRSCAHPSPSAGPAEASPTIWRSSRP